MNNDFWSLFIVWLPHHCQRCGSCERGMGEVGLPPLVVATCVHWWVVVALWSCCWWAWCLVMGSEGSKQLIVVVMWKVVGQGLGRILTHRICRHLFQEGGSMVSTQGIKYLCILKLLWSSWLSAHVQNCGCVHEVKSSNLHGALFYILYNNNNSDKLDPLYLEIPTRLLLDSYWTPCTGLHYTHSLGIHNSL